MNYKELNELISKEINAYLVPRLEEVVNKRRKNMWDML